MPAWYPKRASPLLLRAPVFTAGFECGKLELAGAPNAPSMHAMVVRARTVGAKNIIPKNFAPRGTQSGAELIRTLERQNSAEDFEKSIPFGIFRGSANLLPVLCGGSSRLSLRGMARASVSHIAAPQEPEIQSEPQGEDARFPRVGSYLGPAEYGAEFQEKKAAERDG